MVAAFLFGLMGTMLALVSFLAVGGLSSPQLETDSAEQERTEESYCPPCEFFFRKLVKNEETGKLTQVVGVQERGEPKSGTDLMLDWATGALDHTCIYLQRLYGQESCVLEVKSGKDFIHTMDRLVTQRMVFEPALGASEARCPCETVERVSIVLTKRRKHALPVPRTGCAFGHNAAIELAGPMIDERPQASACTFPNGTRPNNYNEVWLCMEEANCDIKDDWPQLVIFRDPRLVVVSTYFYVKAHGRVKLGDLDDFVARDLANLCEWMAIRYILFSGVLSQQSLVVWYSDALADPLKWYYKFLDLVGLQLPSLVVKGVAEAAATNNLRFTPMHIDNHKGAEAKDDTRPRKFEEEVAPETVKLADDVLRQWLPPVLLARLGVGPAEEEEV